VRSAVAFTLGANLENLVLTGSSTLAGTGNDLANRLTGNGAANLLNGGAGDDTMTGGGGDDIYVVSSAGDQVVETSASGGTDTVRSAVSHTLGDHVENLVLTGTARSEGTGNALANKLSGNGTVNILNGGDGADSLRGNGGADVLNGGSGGDRIYGGSGEDTLSGGGGNDSFHFDSALSASANVDKILDFSVLSDSIQLSARIFTQAGAAGTLAAAAFHRGTAAAAPEDRIVYDPGSGKIFYDADGNGAGAQILFATVTAGTALTNADFLVYG
jgi:Ca2+-binding RTX toxin-like protein